jgi:hypothetical protein
MITGYESERNTTNGTTVQVLGGNTVAVATSMALQAGEYLIRATQEEESLSKRHGVVKGKNAFRGGSRKKGGKVGYAR